MDHGEMSTKETTTLKLIPGYENVMELEQRRQELKVSLYLNWFYIFIYFFLSTSI